jgi:hypothetical protein
MQGISSSAQSLLIDVYGAIFILGACFAQGIDMLFFNLVFLIK